MDLEKSDFTMIDQRSLEDSTVDHGVQYRHDMVLRLVRKDIGMWNSVAIREDPKMGPNSVTATCIPTTPLIPTRKNLPKSVYDL